MRVSISACAAATVLSRHYIVTVTYTVTAITIGLIKNTCTVQYQLHAQISRNPSKRMQFYPAIFMPAWLLALAAIVAHCQNIDTDRPIMREVSGLASDSLFGYSLVLHQTIANPSNRDAALRGARYDLVLG